MVLPACGAAVSPAIPRVLVLDNSYVVVVPNESA